MQIQVINPNTSAPLTEVIAAAARRAAGPGVAIVATGSRTGPPSIESAYDEAMAVPGLLMAVAEGVRHPVDAHVIACFGDPGLLAARELSGAPVLGIAEAAMHMATLLAPGFSIVTTLQRTVAGTERLAIHYGFERQCRRVRATGLEVLALERAAHDPSIFERVLRECDQALTQDGSGAIVLGCSGMAGLCERLAAQLQVPVIDGVGAAVQLAQALVGMGLRTSKRGDYATPPEKTLKGPMAALAAMA